MNLVDTACAPGQVRQVGQHNLIHERSQTDHMPPIVSTKKLIRALGPVEWWCRRIVPTGLRMHPKCSSSKQVWSWHCVICACMCVLCVRDMYIQCTIAHTVKVITVHFHSVKGCRPALSLQWRAEGPHLFHCFTEWRAAGPHFHCSEGPKARTYFTVSLSEGRRRPALSLQWRAQGPHSIILFHSVIPQNLFVCLFVCLTAAFRFRCLHAFWKREPKNKNRTKVESEVRSK